LISKLFGITFGIKLMERGEEKAQITYEKISKTIPDAKDIVEDEDEHERQLLDLIDGERLRYAGSMVLGLNDALVELTGALAGFHPRFSKHACCSYDEFDHLGCSVPFNSHIRILVN